MPKYTSVDFNIPEGGEDSYPFLGFEYRVVRNKYIIVNDFDFPLRKDIEIPIVANKRVEAKYVMMGIMCANLTTEQKTRRISLK